jgi:hypothetical protein
MSEPKDLKKSGVPAKLADLKAMAAEAAEIEKELGGRVIELFSGWMAAKYLKAVEAQLPNLDAEGQMKLLRTFARDMEQHRKLDRNAEKLRAQAKQLEARALDMKTKAQARREAMDAKEKKAGIFRVKFGRN